MKRIPWVLIGFASFAFLLWFGSWKWIEHKFPGNQNEVYAIRGQFGDMFGAANSLFTSLALAGALYTLWLQTKELESQRKDSKRREQETTKQMQILSQQNEAIQEQLKIARDRAREERAPVFKWNHGVCQMFEAGGAQLQFINRGGRFKILRIIHSHGAPVRYKPENAFVAPDAAGEIHFETQPRAKTFYFEIEYENGSAQTEMQKFRWDVASGTPVLV